MKKSELVKMIKEEYASVLKEAEPVAAPEVAAEPTKAEDTLRTRITPLLRKEGLNPVMIQRVLGLLDMLIEFGKSKKLSTSKYALLIKFITKINGAEPTV